MSLDALLPASIRTMAEHVGWGITLAVLREYAGGHVCVPKYPNPEHGVTQRLGIEKAQQLAKHYGMENVTVPNCAAFFQRLRDISIIRDRQQGASNLDLARKYGLSERRIIDICAPLRAA